MDILAFAKGVFEAQRFSKFIGAELTGATPTTAEITLAIRDELKQQHDFVHGGVLSYLADNAITFAGGIALGGNALTSEYKINYVRPAVGETLIARAKVEASGKRQAVCSCAIFVLADGAEKVCAIAQGTVVPAG
ncbi:MULTISPECIES: PaaI family thioesterase [Pseudovibrio]|uniref:PaaI family thioesterase n=1 Tax=Stappiaceae TaxID=2821832 RepID=UPI0023664FC3|nr:MULTISPECIES: PaaI family thioesterase [Pseudovibrio]MDD7910838.1 PaaI family thioesterase [Pseudovibrio exalbescens]MDX5593453.1 PaaI family thioesterase [Pseudovibrio sp. SPO723]